MLSEWPPRYPPLCWCRSFIGQLDDGIHALRSVSGRKRRKLVRLAGSTIAPPDNVHVGPQQQKVIAIDVARALIGYVQDLQRGADGGERPLQRTGIGTRAAQQQQRIAVAGSDESLHRAFVAQP